MNAKNRLGPGIDPSCTPLATAHHMGRHPVEYVRLVAAFV